ncbi:MAG: NAD(P)-dependent oxidoreductase [bacterium]
MDNPVKKVLITGGAGGLGAVYTRRFARAGYQVRMFDLPTPVNKKNFRRPERDIELFWGDITDWNSVREAVRGVDHVFHLAALVVPATEKNPELAYKVNVGGTKNVLDAAEEESERTGRAVPVGFSSSVTVFGITKDETPPITVDHPLNPTDNYNGTKIKAEALVRNAAVPWSIFRFAAVVYLIIRKGDFARMRMIPPENRIEFVHIHDVCDALLNSINNEEAVGKTFILGGGPRCRMTYREQTKRTFDFLGLPEPDWSKFTDKPFYLDWYDTVESQRILKFQNRDFGDYLRDFKKALGMKYYGSRYVAGPAMKLLGIRL